jgi:hypothetical protein
MLKRERERATNSYNGEACLNKPVSIPFFTFVDA